MTQRFGSCGLTSPLRRLRWSRQMRRRGMSRRRVMRCAHRSFFAGFAGCLSRLAGRALRLPSCSRSLSRSLHMLRRMQVRLSKTEREDQKEAMRLSLAEMNDAAAARALRSSRS
jgi:hypothetical protein